MHDYMRKVLSVFGLKLIARNNNKLRLFKLLLLAL